MSCSVYEKLMFQKLICRPSLFWVLDETLIHKILEDRRPALPNFRRLLLNNVHDHTVLWLAYVRGISIRQLHSKYAKAPNVYLCVVAALTPDQFRCHPAHCSNLARTRVTFSRELGRVSKVCQLHLTFSVDQDVITLDITVNDVTLVQVLQTQ